MLTPGSVLNDPIVVTNNKFANIISTTQVSPSSSINITQGFSSEYDNYLIYASNLFVDGTDETLVRLYIDGVLNITANSYLYARCGGGAYSSQTDAKFEVCATGGSGFVAQIINANSDIANGYTFMSEGRSRSIVCGRSVTGKVTGFEILTAGDNFTGGTVTLYGINKS